MEKRRVHTDFAFDVEERGDGEVCSRGVMSTLLRLEVSMRFGNVQCAMCNVRTSGVQTTKLLGLGHRLARTASPMALRIDVEAHLH